jgi:hypothetical protein
MARSRLVVLRLVVLAVLLAVAVSAGYAHFPDQTFLDW